MQILQNVWTALTTENEVLVNFICIPFYFIEATISMLLFTTLLNIKCSVKRKMIYIFSLSILSVLSRLFIPDPHGTYFNILICFVLILCIFKLIY